MPHDFASQRELLLDVDLGFLGGAPVVYHCHHFNLFLDQTIDDALGSAAGAALRTEAAAEAAYELIKGLANGLGAQTPAERVDIAQTIFAAMGHGRLVLDAHEGRGTANGTHLHYGHSWSEKYGRDVRRRSPADAFAAGFAAATAEVAYNLPRGSTRSVETKCCALREPSCSFELAPGAARVATPAIGIAETRAAATRSMSGEHETKIRDIASGLQNFLSGVAGDERGLVQAFGVFVTMHLASYYNRISYAAVEQTRAKQPKVVGVLEGLLRESGQVCVFHTIGGILLSPEWEGMVGAPSGDVEEHVIACCAIARALGFGRWIIEDLDPDKRLVLRAPASYESPYALRNGVQGGSYFLQGAGVGFMELGHRVPWTESPQLNDKFYRDLFKRGQQWKAEQTRDVAHGDDFCEVVVTRV